MGNWFSNFVPFEYVLVAEGIRYRTVEHFYQAMKCLERADRETIASLPTPVMAKQAGRRVRLRPDWDAKKEAVMMFALRHKFREGTEQRKLLLASTDDLVEVNYWHDNYWGACTCAGCRGKVKLNKLGKMLTSLREQIREVSCL